MPPNEIDPFTVKRSRIFEKKMVRAWFEFRMRRLEAVTTM